MPFEFVLDHVYVEYIFFVLLMGLVITVLLANKVERIVRATTLQTMLLVTVLEIADTADYWMSQLTYTPWWRYLTSFIGYACRPMIAWALICTLMENKRKTRYLLLIPAVINALVYSTCFWTDVAFTFNENNVWNAGPLARTDVVTVVIYVVIILFLLVRRYRKFEKIGVMSIFFVVCATGASVLEILGDHPHVLYPTILIILLMYYIYIYTIRMKTMMDATELELREQKVALSMSQLKPHFISNGMATIRRLIKKDPDKAVEAMDYFVDYLRITIDNVKETDMVRASEELKFVRDYLYIEKLRFGDALQFDISEDCEDFLLPPFTIQPIVENAIRHGIRKREDGSGLVRVQVYTDEKEHCIVVEDNGIGFDVNALPEQNDGHEHVGTKNVRFRLESLCKGYMDMQSEPGAGTRVCIHVPIQK